AAPLNNLTVTLTDQFATRNRFLGGQVGVEAAWHWGRITVDTRAKLGIGSNEQELTIAGASSLISPTFVPLGTIGTGLLAGPANQGQFTHHRLSYLPEFGVNLGFQLTDFFRFYAGYTLLYFTNVLRPGDQIDRSVGLNGTRPALLIRETDFWAQGLNVGFE